MCLCVCDCGRQRTLREKNNEKKQQNPKKRKQQFQKLVLRMKFNKMVAFSYWWTNSCVLPVVDLSVVQKGANQSGYFIV